MKYDVSMKITIDGETHTIPEWASLYELYPSTIRARYKEGDRGYELLEPTHRDKLGINLMKILCINCGAVNGCTQVKK